MGETVASGSVAATAGTCDRRAGPVVAGHPEGAAGTVPCVSTADAEVGGVRRVSSSGDTREHLLVGRGQLEAEVGRMAVDGAEEVRQRSDQVHVRSRKVIALVISQSRS